MKEFFRRIKLLIEGRDWSLSMMFTFSTIVYNITRHVTMDVMRGTPAPPGLKYAQFWETAGFAYVAFIVGLMAELLILEIVPMLYLEYKSRHKK